MMWGIAAVIVAYALRVGVARLVCIAWLYAVVESGKPGRRVRAAHYARGDT